MSTPLSTIYICQGVRLTNDYKHSIYFEDSIEQMDYFMGKVCKTFLAYSYLRKSWKIKVDADMSEARQWSYLFFNNPNVSGTNTNNSMFYFYFITNIEYINDGTVELTLELDVLQTYRFRTTILPCYVDREHSATDILGENLIDENLEVGEYTYNRSQSFGNEDGNALMVLATFNVQHANSDTKPIDLGSSTDGVYNGLQLFAVHPSKFEEFSQKLINFDKWGYSDGIVAMWMYPLCMLSPQKFSDGSSYEWSGLVAHKITQTSGSPKEIFTRSKKLDGYTPRNKKLLSYPFNFLYATNFSGDSAIYRYENFSGDATGEYEFEITGSALPGGGIQLLPLDYFTTGSNVKFVEGLTLSNFPQCGWMQDSFKLWLAQTENQRAHERSTAMITGVAGLVGAGASLATGNVTGALASGAGVFHSYNTIANQMAQIKDRSIEPPHAKGNINGNINIKENHACFCLFDKSIKAQQAMILDDYFDLYGYATRRVKMPNVKARENWTYIKTVNAHIVGDLCTEDIVKIQSIFDNGITFWTDGDQIGNYNLTNNTINSSEVKSWVGKEQI